MTNPSTGQRRTRTAAMSLPSSSRLDFGSESRGDVPWPRIEGT